VIDIAGRKIRRIFWVCHQKHHSLSPCAERQRAHDGVGAHIDVTSALDVRNQASATPRHAPRRGHLAVKLELNLSAGQQSSTGE